MAPRLAKGSSFSSQTQPNTFVSQQYFLAAAAERSLSSDREMEFLRVRTAASFDLKEDKNTVAPRLPGSVLDVCSVTLFCALKTELNTTLLVVQTMLPAMSRLCRVHTINTQTHGTLALGRALRFQFKSPGHLLNSPYPPWQKPEFLHPPPYCLFFSPPFLSCPPFAPFPPEKPVE